MKAGVIAEVKPGVKAGELSFLDGKRSLLLVRAELSSMGYGRQSNVIGRDIVR